MTALQAIALILVAGGGTIVALTRELVTQALFAGLYGLVLAVLFVTFQAPDVALSEVVVGGVVLPLVLLAAIVVVKR